MPVGMAIDILENADIEPFSDQSGVEGCLADLRHPQHQVHFRRLPLTQVMDLEKLNESNMHCKTLELALNYHQRMIRYQFRTPSRRSEDGRELTRPAWLEIAGEI